MRTNKELFMFLFIVFPFLASFFSFILSANLLISVVLYLMVPSLVLSLLQPKSIAKSVIFSTISIPSLLIIDYIAHSMGQWVVPQTAFPFKFFNLVPVEDSIWVFFMCYEVIMFYEYFFDSQKPHELLRKKFIPLLTIAFVIPTLWFLVGSVYPAIFNIRYFYALWGVVLLLVPLFLFLFKYPKLIGKFIYTGLYFFYLALCYELTALFKGWWYFPRTAEFVGWVNINQLFFPLEEFVFWLMLFAMGFLSWYEYFDDDRK